MIGEQLCSRRRCIVVGSAPGVELPKREHHDIVIGANGGAAIARAAGREVDLLVTTAHLFNRTTKVDEAIAQSLEGLTVSSCWVDTKNGSLTQTRVRFMELELEAKAYVDVNSLIRNKVIYEAIGENLWVSTGVWAACLAVVSGASHVVLCGISMHNGHTGMNWDHGARHHKQEDASALRALGPLGVEMPAELVEGVI